MQLGNPSNVSQTADMTTYQPPFGAWHAEEIDYFWRNLPFLKNFNFTKDNYVVSNIMQEYIANFIKSGDPNGDQLIEFLVCIIQLVQ